MVVTQVCGTKMPNLSQQILETDLGACKQKFSSDPDPKYSADQVSDIHLRPDQLLLLF